MRCASWEAHLRHLRGVIPELNYGLIALTEVQAKKEECESIKVLLREDPDLDFAVFPTCDHHVCSAVQVRDLHIMSAFNLTQQLTTVYFPHAKSPRLWACQAKGSWTKLHHCENLFEGEPENRVFFVPSPCRYYSFLSVSCHYVASWIDTKSIGSRWELFVYQRLIGCKSLWLPEAQLVVIRRGWCY